MTKQWLTIHECKLLKLIAYVSFEGPFSKHFSLSGVVLGFIGTPFKKCVYINRQKFIKCFPVLLVLMPHCYIVLQQTYSLLNPSFDLLH